MKFILNGLLLMNLCNTVLGFSNMIPRSRPVSTLYTNKCVLRHNINNKNPITMNMASKNNFENNTTTNVTKIFRINYNNDNLYEDDVNETNDLILRIYIYAVINVMIFEYLFKTFFQNLHK